MRTLVASAMVLLAAVLVTIDAAVLSARADDVKGIKGLKWHTWPDGHKAALHKPGRDGDRAHQTFLVAGTDRVPRGLGYGSSALSIAVHDGSIALVSGQWTHARRAPARLNRLGVGKSLRANELEHPAEEIMPFPPNSVAFSPDKKWLYLTGSVKSDEEPRHAVYRKGCVRTTLAAPLTRAGRTAKSAATGSTATSWSIWRTGTTS